VMVTLHGERVHGRHVLFRTGERKWMIHRMDPPQDATFEALPDGWAPMRARSGDLPEDAERWSFEVAWPGARALAVVDRGRVRQTAGDGGDATGRDVTDRFPEVRPLGRALGARPALLDAVIVAVGDTGRPERALVERRMDGARQPPVVLMLVDVLHLDGHSLTDRQYRARREALEALALAGPAWQTPPAHAGAGAALLEAARVQGLRGVVAKRLDSTYQPGAMSDAWIEVTITAGAHMRGGHEGRT
jgi:bifunctional non-homologous end joining protein LigD